MRQIRARIRDKRGVDYTEAEIRELASVKLDRFLDPRAVRSDLLGHFKRQHQPAPLFLAGEECPARLHVRRRRLAYGSSRDAAGRILRGDPPAAQPDPQAVHQHRGRSRTSLHMQGRSTPSTARLFERVSQRLQTRDELDALNFEMFNNLVVETTRLGIEVKNLRMQVESLSTRLDFDERRARALEGVVQYRPGAPVAPPPPPPQPPQRRPARRGRRRRAGRERRTRHGCRRRTRSAPATPAARTPSRRPRGRSRGQPARRPGRSRTRASRRPVTAATTRATTAGRTRATEPATTRSRRRA